MRSTNLYGDRVTPGSPRDIGPSGLTLVDTLPPGQEAAVAFAGPWAQAFWLAGRRPTMRQVYAVLDTTGCHDRTLLAGAAIAEAAGITPLIERLRGPIVAVAKTLHREGKATHRDVCDALGLPDAGGPGSHARALLASGYAPHSFWVTRPAA